MTSEVVSSVDLSGESDYRDYDVIEVEEEEVGSEEAEVKLKMIEGQFCSFESNRLPLSRQFYFSLCPICVYRRVWRQ